MTNTMKTGVALVLLLCAPACRDAGGDSVSWDVIAAGGTIGSTSTGYAVSASVGQVAVGILGGVAYRLWAGFWNPLLIGTVGVGDEPILGIPHSFELVGNHPNPFTSHTTIRYAVPRHGYVTIGMYDLAGRRVRTLADAAQEPGYHHVTWDGSDDGGRQAASGVYLCRMVAHKDSGRLFHQSRAMLVVR